MKKYSCPFTEEEALAANAEWGANCGPMALAFVLQRPLADMRDVIPDFDMRRYTNPTMMKLAFKKLNVQFEAAKVPMPIFGNPMALVRIQFSGPWCDPSITSCWKYHFTHWVATWVEDSFRFVFDCNGGVQGFVKWDTETLPTIMKTIPRSDGRWFATHLWRPK